MLLLFWHVHKCKPVCYCGDISTPPNMMRHKPKCDWLQWVIWSLGQWKPPKCPGLQYEGLAMRDDDLKSTSRSKTQTQSVSSSMEMCIHASPYTDLTFTIFSTVLDILTLNILHSEQPLNLPSSQIQLKIKIHLLITIYYAMRANTTVQTLVWISWVSVVRAQQ